MFSVLREEALPCGAMLFAGKLRGSLGGNGRMDSLETLESRRSTEEEIRTYREILARADNLEKLMDSFSLVVLVLDARRHILYGNRVFQEILGRHFAVNCVAPRPGEFLGCRYAWDNSLGCGEGKQCRYCGAGDALFSALRENRQVVRECVIETSREGDFSELEFRVTAAPLSFEGHRFLLVTLEDISREKHRERMERAFFHDILNSAGVLQGIGEILEFTENVEDLQEILPLLRQGTALLVEEIEAQRSLLSAEKGTLRVDPIPLAAEPFMRKIAGEMASFPEVARDKEIVVVPPRDPCLALADEVLFRRVLLNMMKNALEATPKGGLVSLGCEPRRDAGEERLLFWVHNQGVMEEDVRRRIFQRSFSTKGEGRGIGTYSMKLFMVQYLRGDIWFVSDEKRGTLFYAALPAWNPKEDLEEGRNEA